MSSGAVYTRNLDWLTCEMLFVLILLLYGRGLTCISSTSAGCTGCTVAGSLSQPKWSRHWALCWLMTKFSLHQWGSCWWFVLLPPAWGEEGSDKDRGANCAAPSDRADCNPYFCITSPQTATRNDSKPALFSVCRPIMICWTVEINVTISLLVHLSGACLAVPGETRSEVATRGCLRTDTMQLYWSSFLVQLCSQWLLGCCNSQLQHFDRLALLSFLGYSW